MNFKQYFFYIEALDAKLKDMLVKGKYGEATPEQIKAAVEELEKEYQSKEGPDRGTAFKFMQNKLGMKAGETKIAVPTDPFLLNYYKKLQNKEITADEYKALQYFAGGDEGLLDEMMTKLRQLLSQDQIKLSFSGKPIIKFKNNNVDKYQNLTQFLSIIHSIEAQVSDEEVDTSEYQNPAFLEMLHDGDLVAKANNIWVFKGDDPVKCRVMGKGQRWCISSSSSAEHYFNYRKEGQTQYFIFDFNKKPNDPARYVNPGVGPYNHSSEWVDSRNEHTADVNGVEFGINGYESLQEYLEYLESMGINTSVFKADSMTDYEKQLHRFVKNQDMKGAKNYPDDKKTKHGLPYMWYYYLKLVHNLSDEEFNTLSEYEKEEYAMGKILSEKQYVNWLFKKDHRYLKEYIQSTNAYSRMLAAAYASDTQNKAEKFIDLILNLKEVLTGSILSDLHHYSSDFDAAFDKIFDSALKKNKTLQKDAVKFLIERSKDPYEAAKKLGTENMNKLGDGEVNDLLVMDENRFQTQMSYELEDGDDDEDLFAAADRLDGLVNALIDFKTNLSEKQLLDLHTYARKKDEIAEKILERTKANSLSIINNLITNSFDKLKMAKRILDYKEKISRDEVNTILFNLSREEKQEFMITMLNKKVPLTAGTIFNLIGNAKNKKAIIQLLGPENIKKLNTEMGGNVEGTWYDYLVRHSENPLQMQKDLVDAMNKA
jgi:hypothetical protein